nr:MAG TPA: hypothetical protein [Caudoviricetes sp.]
MSLFKIKESSILNLRRWCRTTTLREIGLH